MKRCHALLVALLSLVSLAAVQNVSLSVPTLRWPQPVQQHEFFKTLEGIWDADVKIYVQKDTPVTLSGSETVRAACNGQWCAIDLDCGEKEQGYVSRTTIGFDPELGRYDGLWVDMRAPTWSTFQGALAAEGKTLTLTGEGPDPNQPKNRVKIEQVMSLTKKNERTWTVHLVNPDGEKIKWLEATYKFKKKK